MHEPAGVVEILVQIFPENPQSEVQFQNSPPKMKIIRVQIGEFQNTPPPMKIVRESKSESLRIPPQKWKLSESPNPRVSEYPPKIGKTSDFKLQNSLKIWEIYVETNL